jgi:hypothetical protein
MAIAAAVALPLLAAEKLAAKPGLWETTSTTNMGGMVMPTMPTLPPAMLENLSPAQRAQLEQVMGAASGKPVTTRSCVTEKDLAEGAFRQLSQPDLKCTFTTVSSTPKRQETTFQCTSPAGPADGKLIVDVVDAEHVKGTVQIKTQAMAMDIKADGKWLAADCGTTK